MCQYYIWGGEAHCVAQITEAPNYKLQIAFSSTNISIEHNMQRVNEVIGLNKEGKVYME